MIDRRALVGLLLSLILVTSESACGSADESDYPPQTRLEPASTPTGVPRPDYLEPVTDETFGTKVTRISDPQVFDQPRRTVIRHIYAKNQPWNSDGSLLMLDWGYPASLLDGETYRYLGQVHQPSQAIWLNTKPDRTIGTSGNKLIEWNMREDRLARIDHRFSDYKSIDLGAGEGDLSNDDRFVALFGKLPHRKIDVILYDREADRIVSRKRFKKATIGSGKATFNNVAMSQSGRFVIVEFNKAGYGKRSGIVAYPRDKAPVALSGRGGSHFDSCVDPEGNDVIVTGADEGSAIISARLADGKRRTILPAGFEASFAIHVSCRNLDRPGWAYISDFAAKGVPQGTRPGEVFAAHLDGSGTVERFAHEHISSNPAYAHGPMAVPSRDGTRVLFASDWGTPRGPVLAYVAGAR